MRIKLLNERELKLFFEKEIPCNKIYVQKTKIGSYPQIKFFIRCKNIQDKTSQNQFPIDTVIQYLDDGSFFFTGKLLKEKRGYISAGKNDYYNSILGGCCEQLSSFTSQNFLTIPPKKHYPKLTTYITLNKNIDNIIKNFFENKNSDNLKVKDYILMEKNINKLLFKYLKKYENAIEY